MLFLSSLIIIRYIVSLRTEWLLWLITRWRNCFKKLLLDLETEIEIELLSIYPKISFIFNIKRLMLI